MTARNLKYRKITLFHPHCRRFPPSKPRFSHTRGPFILITLIVGILVLLPQGNETIVLPPEEIRTASCASSMIQTPDSGFVLVGETYQDTGNATTTSSTWMVKIDATGQLEWNLMFDYLDADIIASSLLQSSNSEFTIAGTFLSGYHREQSFILRTNFRGIPNSFQIYGEQGVTLSSLIQTTEGDFILIGSEEDYDEYNPINNTWLMKIPAAGAPLWTNVFEGILIGEHAEQSLVQTADGGFAFVGYSLYRTYERNHWLVKTDTNGIIEWNQTVSYGRPSCYRDDTGGNTCVGSRFETLIQTEDGGFVLAGCNDSSGIGDICLVKTDATGGTLWTQNCRGFYVEDPSNRIHATRITSLVLTKDGGLVLAGNSGFSWGVLGTSWVMKTDANGVVQWNQTFKAINRASVDALVFTNDGGYAFAGGFEDDFWLVKLDANGHVQWNQTYNRQTPEVMMLSLEMTPSYSSPIFEVPPPSIRFPVIIVLGTLTALILAVGAYGNYIIVVNRFLRK